MISEQNARSFLKKNYNKRSSRLHDICENNFVNGNTKRKPNCDCFRKWSRKHR